MKFLVVVPTIRQQLPEFSSTIDRIRASFTHPTEFHLLDGTGGKVKALNRAFDDLLTESDCDVYVTLDDDFIPPQGWQGRVQQAFEKLPRVGAVGLWIGDDDESLAYMGAQHCGELKSDGDLQYRLVLGRHHIVGCFIAFRKSVALCVGKLPESDLEYQIWEDAWRGRKAQACGWSLAFVYAGLPTLVAYDDTEQYRSRKAQDLEGGSRIAFEILETSGVREPWLIRLRRKIAKWRGRA